MDIDPEGFQSGGPACICGPLYTYGGMTEPGQFHPECPTHTAFQSANVFIRNENVQKLNDWEV